MEKEFRLIGNRIKNLRKIHSITQKQLAEALNLSITNMCNIENGRTAVTLQNLIKMKEVFGCELKDFFVDQEGKPLEEQREEQREQTVETKKATAELPESLELQDAINLLRLLRRIDIKGI